jgi:tetraacyldisaccharide-1-P 4'-kinase
MININDCQVLDRENVSALNRADVVIYKPSYDSSGDYYKKTNKMNNKKILKMVAQALFSIEDGNNINNIKNIEPMIAVCGIGDPGSFKKALINNNFIINEFLSYDDNYNYTVDDMEFIYNKMVGNNCQTIITTTKDFYKLNALNNKNKKIIMLKMKFDFLNTGKNGHAKKDELVALLAATIRK